SKRQAAVGGNRGIDLLHSARGEAFGGLFHLPRPRIDRDLPQVRGVARLSRKDDVIPFPDRGSGKLCRKGLQSSAFDNVYGTSLDRMPAMRRRYPPVELGGFDELSAPTNSKRSPSGDQIG